MTKEYKTYLQSKEWAQLKIDLFELRGKKCEKCGSIKIIHVHHLTYVNIFNEEPEDLIILCSDCHKKEHSIINNKRAVKFKKLKNKKNKKVAPLIKKSKQINYLNKKLISLNKKYRRGVFSSDTFSVNIRAIYKKIKMLEK